MPLQEIAATDDRQLQRIADLTAGSHKVVLITGAGISTSCGIPVSTIPCLCSIADFVRTSVQKTVCII